MSEGYETVLPPQANLFHKKPLHSKHCSKETGTRVFNHAVTSIDRLTVKAVKPSKIGFLDDSSEVFKSDFLRFHALHAHGGMWSDLDIVYQRPIPEHINNTTDNLIFKCKADESWGNQEYFPVGLFMAKPKSKFFQFILDSVPFHFDSRAYQSIGTDMFNSLFLEKSTFELETFRGERSLVLDNSFYLPLHWYETEQFLDPEAREIVNATTKDAVGVHWFNGHPLLPNYLTRVQSGQSLVEGAGACFLDQITYPYVKDILTSCGLLSGLPA